MGCATSAPKLKPGDPACIVTRAAFDIGSATTKVRVAKVDACLQKILEVLHDQEVKIDYKEDVMGSGKSELSAQIMSRGLEIMALLTQGAAKKGVPDGHMAGVATSAFRDAKNGGYFTDLIKKQTGVRIKIISQREEGLVGYFSALTELKGLDTSKVSPVVWDIGGGTQQFTTRSVEKFEVYEGDLASLSFKDRVVKQILQRESGSPNPIGIKNMEATISLAQMHAKASIPKSILAQIEKNSGVVYGIGGVHRFSVGGQTQKQAYTQTDVARALKSQVQKTDSQIGGKFAETDVTNLALVLGYMAHAKISEVRVLKINATQGVLIDPSYWP